MILFKNINLKHYNKVSKNVYLEINKNSQFKCFEEIYKTAFSMNRDFDLKILENLTNSSLLNVANELVLYGWKKEAIPITQSKNPLLQGFLILFLGNFCFFFRNISCFKKKEPSSIRLQMQDIYQKTLSKNVKFSGIGLHSGKSCSINVIPAKEDEGIVFKRVDVKKNNLIRANFKNVSSARLCTTLQNNYGVKVSTVEHLLAAFYITGIDNAVVEIDNEEVPIMDGSSKDFIKGIKKINLIDQLKKRKYLNILKRVELIDGNRKISIEPNQSSLEVDFQLNYKNKIIGDQKNNVNFQKDNLNEVTSSRTFVCMKI